MIQLNLLPDVKLEYIKAQRSQRLMVSISFLVAAVALAILVILLLVDVAQKKHLSDLGRDIKSESSQLQGKKDINKILTVQNQLQSLTGLHEGKPAADRLFSNYLDQVTPAAVSINSFHIDFTTQTITITGTADKLAIVNQYVDTLKFTTYTTDSNRTATKAFSNVVLTSFGLNSSAPANQAASYTISTSYDRTIFDITQKVNLTVPNQVTTRSDLSHPGDLFQAAPPSANQPATNPSGAGQ